MMSEAAKRGYENRSFDYVFGFFAWHFPVSSVYSTPGADVGLEWRRSRIAGAVDVLCRDKGGSTTSSKTHHVLQPAASQIPFPLFYR